MDGLHLSKILYKDFDWDDARDLNAISFFNSRFYLKNLYEKALELGATVFVVKAKLNNKLVGIGFFTVKHNLLLTTIELFKTGIDELDNAFYNEYLDFLYHKNLSTEDIQSIRSDMLTWLTRAIKTTLITRVRLPASTVDLSKSCCFKKTIIESRAELSYRTILDTESDKLDSHRNQRYLKKKTTILKLNKKFFPQGSAISEPIDATEALTYFNEFTQLHQKNWVDKGFPGAFCNENALSVHKSLLSQSYDKTFEKEQRPVRLFKVLDKATGLPIAYHYFFMYKDTAYLYQSGVSYFEDNKCQPGYYSHLELMSYMTEHAPEIGIYDFMTGSANYKQNLTNATISLFWNTAYKKSILTSLFLHLRNLRRKLILKTRE